MFNFVPDFVMQLSQGGLREKFLFFVILCLQANLFWSTILSMTFENKMEVHFFAQTSGNQPVKKWLDSLTDLEVKDIMSDVATVRESWPLVRKPLVDSLGNGLWEVRSRLPNRIARVIFSVEGNVILLLHGFIKKTQQTDPDNIAIAKKRLKIWKNI